MPQDLVPVRVALHFYCIFLVSLIHHAAREHWRSAVAAVAVAVVKVVGKLTPELLGKVVRTVACCFCLLGLGLPTLAPGFVVEGVTFVQLQVRVGPQQSQPTQLRFFAFLGAKAM